MNKLKLHPFMSVAVTPLEIRKGYRETIKAGTAEQTQLGKYNSFLC